MILKRVYKKTWLILSFSLIVAFFSQAATAGSVLQHIKKRDRLVCGVAAGLKGFALPNSKGVYEGIDVDYCKAMAAVILGDAKKVTFRPLTPAQRFVAAQSGEIDVLARGTTWIASRDGNLGIRFVGINFYDGQGILVRKSLKAHSIKDLAGATFCIQSGNTAEQTLASAFKKSGVKRFKTVATEEFKASIAQLEAKRCDAYTTDKSGLLYMKTSLLKKPDDYTILSETFSKEPLGPAVRSGDEELFLIGRWVLHAMINAEELGINSKNVDSLMKHKSKDVRIQSFLGQKGKAYRSIGLDSKWAYRVVKQVGNYGESFKRNMPKGMARGYNNLWNHGGLLYAPPIR